MWSTNSRNYTLRKSYHNWCSGIITTSYKMDIREILYNSINAPSGANSQPWSFLLPSQDVLVIRIHPEKDHKILNYRNRGTLMALGALIENIVQTASSQQYEVGISPFRTTTNTIDLSFSRQKLGNKLNQNLSTFIKDRTTNRKPYKNEPLSKEEDEMLRAVAESTLVRFLSTSDSRKCIDLGNSLAIFEKLMLEHDDLRKLSFNEIVWSDTSVREDCSGILIKTLELESPKRFVLKLLQKAFFMRCANAIGLPSIIAADAGKTYGTCSKLGALAIQDTDEDFIEAGRVLERIWLQATALGLSFQPVTGILFLQQFIQSNHTLFSNTEEEVIRAAYQNIAHKLDTPPNTILAAVFRIGKSEPPSLRTAKATPKIVTQ